jgi:hypothetical protein
MSIGTIDSQYDNAEAILLEANEIRSATFAPILLLNPSELRPTIQPQAIYPFRSFDDH